MFQLFVGEIGIDRHTFYYDLRWWEVKAIIRGYNARHHTSWEQMRWVAYHVNYCMGLPKGETAPKVTEWVKFPWEKEPPAPITNAERDELLADIDAENARLAAERKKNESL